MKLNKKIAACAFAVYAIPFAASAGLSRVEWQSKIGDCANDPRAMKSTIAQISASEQAAFVGKVNEAMGKMPGTPEFKSAAFYMVNKAAVIAATDKKNVLAEVFASVPVEYLTDINERFASELFGRNVNPEKKIGDNAFLNLATNTLAVVNRRCESAKDAGVRQTFAALLFVRASGGSPEGLVEILVSQMTNPQAKASASSWIAEALGSEGEGASYDSMLDASGAEAEPDHSVVLQMTGPGDVMESLLSDLQDPSKPASGMGGGNFEVGSIAGASVPSDDLSDIGLNRIPRGAISSKTAVGGSREGPNTGDNPYYSNHRGSSVAPVDVPNVPNYWE